MFTGPSSRNHLRNSACVFTAAMSIVTLVCGCPSSVVSSGDELRGVSTDGKSVVFTETYWHVHSGLGGWALDTVVAEYPYVDHDGVATPLPPPLFGPVNDDYLSGDASRILNNYSYDPDAYELRSLSTGESIPIPMQQFQLASYEQYIGAAHLSDDGNAVVFHVVDSSAASPPAPAPSQSSQFWLFDVASGGFELIPFPYEALRAIPAYTWIGGMSATGDRIVLNADREYSLDQPDLPDQRYTFIWDRGSSSARELPASFSPELDAIGVTPAVAFVLSVSSDGNRLIFGVSSYNFDVETLNAGSIPILLVYDIAESRTLALLARSGEPQSDLVIAASRNGKFLVSATSDATDVTWRGRLSVRDLDAATVQTLEIPEIAAEDFPISKLFISDDGARVSFETQPADSARIDLLDGRGLSKVWQLDRATGITRQIAPATPPR